MPDRHPSDRRRPAGHSPVHRRCSTTLIAIALGFAAQGSGFHAGALTAATATERDEHFAAAARLMEQGFRLPGQRQMEEFAKAGYPDDEIHRAGLAWQYGDRFRTRVPADRAAEVEQAFADAKAKLEAGLAADRLPKAVKTLYGAMGGQTARLVNDICQVIHPEVPPDLSGMVLKERADEVNRQVKALCEQVGSDWAKALKQIDAHKEAEAKLWDLPENDPQHRKIADQAINLRYAAVNGVYTGHIALREIITRGKDFSLDPEPAKVFLTAFIKENGKTIDDWGFEWGDQNPLINAYAQIILGEGVRLKIKGFNPDDVEGNMRKACDIPLRDVPKAMQNQVLGFQIKMWTALIKWRFELASPRSYARGVELWNEFQGVRKANPLISLASSDRHIAEETARAHIAAARLFHAKGDTAQASALMAAVGSARGNALAPNAKLWLTHWATKGGAGGGEWGTTPTATEPATATTVARAMMGTALGVADQRQARSFYLNSAVILRNGVLGLSSGAFADQFVEYGPDIYTRYATALSKLDMRYHAALASLEGLRAVAAQGGRADAAKNPWRRKVGNASTWNDHGLKVQRLVRSALAHASSLYEKAKGPGVQALYNDIIELVTAISPEDGGVGLSKNQVALGAGEGKYEEAIAKAREVAKQHPDEYWWAFGAIANVRQSWYGSLEKEPNKAGNKELMTRLAKEMADASEQALAALAAQLPKATGEDRAKLLRARSAAMSSRLYMKMKEKQYAEVMAELGPAYWKNPPEDRALAARMLTQLALATRRFYEQATAGDQAKDPQVILDQWKPLTDIHRIFHDKHGRFASEDDPLHIPANNLGSVFHKIGVQVDWFRTNAAGLKLAPDVLAKLEPIGDQAKRLMADLIAPIQTRNSPPDTLIGLGLALWELDDRAGAARLLEWHREGQATNADLIKYQQDAKTVLDGFEAQLATRPELRPDWARLRDLLEDRDSTRQAIRAGQTDPAKWGEARLNYPKALGQFREYRKKVEGLRSLIGSEAFKTIAPALDGLEKLIRSLANDIVVMDRLAQFYRQNGRGADANALYDRLLQYDPLDPEYTTAYVDITIDRVKTGSQPQPTKDDLTRARSIAIDNRQTTRQGTETWWTSAIQVMELSAALGDSKSISNTLRGFRVGKSDISYDLVKPPVKWSDPRVREARNKLARVLCERYLKLFELGVDEKPSFRILDIEVDGQTLTVFAEPGATRYFGQKIADPDGDEVLIFWEEGKPLPRIEAEADAAKAEAAPTPGPETAGPTAGAPPAPGAPPAGSPVPVSAPAPAPAAP